MKVKIINKQCQWEKLQRLVKYVQDSEVPFVCLFVDYQRKPRYLEY